jgi:hypothetical protein
VFSARAVIGGVLKFRRPRMDQEALLAVLPREAGSRQRMLDIDGSTGR